MNDYYNIHFVAPVVIQLEVLSATSVRVSWDRLDIPEITGYIVYYSQTGNSEMVPTQHFINVFSSTNIVLLTDLTSNVEYQFEVVAVAKLDGDVVMGERSNEYTERLTPTSVPATQINIVTLVGGVLAFAVAFVAVVVVIIIFVLSRSGFLFPSYTVKLLFSELLYYQCIVFKEPIYLHNNTRSRRTTTTVRSNDTLVDTPFQLISGFFHVNQGVLCCAGVCWRGGGGQQAC